MSAYCSPIGRARRFMAIVKLLKYFTAVQNLVGFLGVYEFAIITHYSRLSLKIFKYLIRSYHSYPQR
ncbi:hypothetical protein QTP88_014130 [Uroleucon formosanum]